MFSEFLCQIVVSVNVKRFHIVTYSSTTLLLIKTFFYETNNIFLSQILEMFMQNCQDFLKIQWK